MSPIDTIHSKYSILGIDFAAMLESHYQHGFVFSTPEFFIMGRPVDREEAYNLIREPSYTFPPNRCDAWWIYAMAGKVEKAWSILPYSLPYIGFERFDENPRFYPTTTLMRLSKKD